MKLTKNIWGTRGSDYEVQRRDLWVLDMDVAAKTMRYNIDKTCYHAQALQLPELTVKQTPARQDSINYLAPSWDDALPIVKVDFLYQSQFGLHSPLFSFFEYWLRRVRAGRPYRSITYGRYPTVYLDPKVFKVECMFDIQVVLLRGKGLPPIGTDLDDWLMHNEHPIDRGAAYVLKECWPCSMGYNQLDYKSGNDALEFNIQLVCKDIAPIGNPIDLGVFTPDPNHQQDPVGLERHGP